MASSDKPEIVERDIKDKDKDPKEDEKDEKKDEEKGGFIEKVKDFIHDIGEKIEEAIGFGKPTADVSDIHIPSINLEKVDIVVDVLITNPNPVPIPLIDINYLVESNGRKLVSGLIPDSGTIHAHGSETVKIPLTLVYDDIKKTYADIKPGSIIPYRIKVDLIVDVPVLGRLTLPLEKTGEIPIPYKPDIDLEKIRFEKFSFEETVANLHLKVENLNDFDLGLTALDYEVWLSEVSIGSAELSKSTTLAKNGVSYIDIPITFRPKDQTHPLSHTHKNKRKSEGERERERERSHTQAQEKRKKEMSPSNPQSSSLLVHRIHNTTNNDCHNQSHHHHHHNHHHAAAAIPPAVPDSVAPHHAYAVGPNQCCSAVVQEIAAPVGAVWSVVRRFDIPQSYKHFVKSCRVISGDCAATGALREVRVVSGLPAARSTERLEILDDHRHVISFSVVGGDHRLANYRSVTTLHPSSDAGTVVVESYVVDVPPGNTKEETCGFVDTIVRCNLNSLAQITQNLAGSNHN